MTTINADGATDTIYFQSVDNVVNYKINDGSLQPISIWPATITNSNATPSSNILGVVFLSDLVLTSQTQYFECGSGGIQFGLTTVNANGTKPTISISATADYPGLIKAIGCSDIYIYNLHVSSVSGSSLAIEGGWIGQIQFGQNGANNFIFGCSSDGDISSYGGGIVGREGGSDDSSPVSVDLSIIGCSSSGSIGLGGGGIISELAGFGGGTILVKKCSSSGSIGTAAGGIVGVNAGNTGGTVTVNLCYSTGNISTSGGGILGAGGGSDGGTASAVSCYSQGSIAGQAGGIFGEFAASTGGTATATNCYSSGAITDENTGIFGGSPDAGAIQTTCYVANGSWNSTTAQTTLTMTPYISVVVNQPFELRNIGPSPYSLTTIDAGGEDMTLSFSQSVVAGSTSIAAVLAGLSSFSILDGGDATITIDSGTGVLSTTSETPVNVYTLLIRAVTNPYSITTFSLTVTEAPPKPSPSGSTVINPFPTRGKGYDFELYNKSRVGERLVRERLENPNIRFKSFEDYNKYKMALLKLQQ